MLSNNSLDYSRPGLLEKHFSIPSDRLLSLKILPIRIIASSIRPLYFRGPIKLNQGPVSLRLRDDFKKDCCIVECRSTVRSILILYEISPGLNMSAERLKEGHVKRLETFTELF